MTECPTVRIVPKEDVERQGNYIIINESDFDKKTMKLYDGPENEPVSNGEEVASKSVEELEKELVVARAKEESDKASGANDKPNEGGWGANT